MNAKEARKMTDENVSNHSTLLKPLMAQGMQGIYKRIKGSAKNGLSEVKINLRDTDIADLADKHSDKIKIELEKNGYLAELVLERRVDGAREILVRW